VPIQDAGSGLGWCEVNKRVANAGEPMKKIGVFADLQKRVIVFAVTLGLAVAAGFCHGCRGPGALPAGGRRIDMVVTAYCPCGRCCGWRRNWLGHPVYASGRLKGRPKAVGVCADGTRARVGTIAADTRYYPFGTRIYVPGYGYGTVHDRGGAIQGPRRLDVFFPKHGEAVKWGRRALTVVIFDRE